MKKSEYFVNLAALYEAEIEDLRTDCDGNDVLAKRLREKRAQLRHLLPMLAFSPEMVAPAFHGAFVFSSPARITDALQRAPEDPDFPTWAALAPAVAVAPWAQPLVATVLPAPGGDTFLVVAAALEFLRHHDTPRAAAVLTDPEPRPRRADDENDDDEGDAIDLAEAGNDWLAGQGFDRLES